MLPFSPPETYTRALSGENATPIKLAFRSIRFTVGAALPRSEISVSEKGPAPLLSVASMRPFGDSAMPNGFGACTFTSTPAGVTSRPFGRTAALTPSITVSVLAGRLPAGAAKRTNCDSPPSCPPCSAAADHAPAIHSINTAMPPAPAVSRLCRPKYSPIVASSREVRRRTVRVACIDSVIAL